MRELKHIALSLNLFLFSAAYLVAQGPSPARRPDELVLGGTDKGGPYRQIRPLSLPGGRLLVCVGNAVYMINANGEQQWKYENVPLTSEPAFNAGLNEIAVVMYDLQAVRLDAATGKVKWRSDAVGKGLFAVVSAYERGFLVVVNMSGYRQGGSRVPADSLEYWGESESESWHADFPMDSELVVSGERIYALRHGEDRIYLRPIQTPTARNQGARQR
jgi:hypothetical protein